MKLRFIFNVFMCVAQPARANFFDWLGGLNKAIADFFTKAPYIVVDCVLNDFEQFLDTAQWNESTGCMYSAFEVAPGTLLVDVSEVEIVESQLPNNLAFAFDNATTVEEVARVVSQCLQNSPGQVQVKVNKTLPRTILTGFAKRTALTYASACLAEHYAEEVDTKKIGGVAFIFLAVVLPSLVGCCCFSKCLACSKNNSLD